jgi:NhaA family Na+:H+ antiporter
VYADDAEPRRGPPVSETRTVFDRLPLPERTRILEALRQETVGGALLLTAAVVALVWANSPWRESYTAMTDFVIGPAALGLDLSLETWAADGLLAVFFFVAGLELKHELVVGTLSKPAKAVVPVAAAIAGMVVPAALFAITITALGDTESRSGWGIPMATDIAFALAVLAVMGRRLPVALRAFLLTLAVVDDLGAIMVIAIFYSDKFALVPFLGAVAGCAVWWFLQRRRVNAWPVYLLVGIVTWVFMHESGIHATVAGVALGMLTRVRLDPGEEISPADRYEHAVRPISAGFCVPVFALMAAGVTVIGLGTEALTAPLAIAIVVGLVIGKPIGVFGGAWLVARFTRASLSTSLQWRDIAAVGVLAGVGFTVSLLIGELAFTDEVQGSEAKIGILAASVIAAAIASVLLLLRGRHYAELYDAEEADTDGDGIPDVYQR